MALKKQKKTMKQYGNEEVLSKTLYVPKSVWQEIEIFYRTKCNEVRSKYIKSLNK